jgi:hypothetical protein
VDASAENDQRHIAEWLISDRQEVRLKLRMRSAWKVTKYVRRWQYTSVSLEKSVGHRFYDILLKVVLALSGTPPDIQQLG